MSISDGVALGSTIATFLGVVVALIALVVQLQALNKQLQVQTFSEYTRRYQEIFLRVPEVFDDKTNLDDLSPQSVANLRAYFDLCFEEHHLFHEQKLVSKKTWLVWKGGMRTAFARPLMKQAWKWVRVSGDYGPTFEIFVDRLMSNQPN